MSLTNCKYVCEFAKPVLMALDPTNLDGVYYFPQPPRKYFQSGFTGFVGRFKIVMLVINWGYICEFVKSTLMNLDQANMDGVYQ